MSIRKLLILIALLFTAQTAWGATLIDSYTNYSGATIALIDYGGGEYYDSAGQSFTSTGGTLNSAKFRIITNDVPDGNLYAKIYALTGTYGVDEKPTGSALATSEAVSANGKTGWVTFNFSGANKISLSNGEHYAVILYYDSVHTDSEIDMAADSVTLGHSGHEVFKQGLLWDYMPDFEVNFYVYGDDPIPSRAQFKSSVQLKGNVQIK